MRILPGCGIHERAATKRISPTYSVAKSAGALAPGYFGGPVCPVFRVHGRCRGWSPHLPLAVAIVHRNQWRSAASPTWRREALHPAQSRQHDAHEEACDFCTEPSDPPQRHLPPEAAVGPPAAQVLCGEAAGPATLAPFRRHADDRGEPDSCCTVLPSGLDSLRVVDAVATMQSPVLS